MKSWQSRATQHLREWEHQLGLVDFGVDATRCRVPYGSRSATPVRSPRPTSRSMLSVLSARCSGRPNPRASSQSSSETTASHLEQMEDDALGAEPREFVQHPDLRWCAWIEVSHPASSRSLYSRLDRLCSGRRSEAWLSPSEPTRPVESSTERPEGQEIPGQNVRIEHMFAILFICSRPSLKS
jgi:hypothetical protein